MGLTSTPPIFTLAAAAAGTATMSNKPSKRRSSKATTPTPLHALLTLLNPAARAAAHDLADVHARLRRLRAYVASNTLTQAEYDAYCARITSALERKETAPAEARAKILALEDALALIVEDEDEDAGEEDGYRTMQPARQTKEGLGKEGREMGVRARVLLPVRRGRGRLLRRWSGGPAEEEAVARGLRCAVGGSVPALPLSVLPMVEGEEGRGRVFRDGRRAASAPASLPPRTSEVWPFDAVPKRGRRLRQEEWFGLGEFEFEQEGSESGLSLGMDMAVGVGVVGAGAGAGVGVGVERA
ncbi:uncharacterized protein K452DRAFT_311273 [Aplosporella prunicola CBS 121167]|uniref:Uncharacterized protein n=1 Tax=Aplosporella prunicola CBS 121167 TaxID=1176127 RepID=A0A6A6B5A5_9PEZI|nr:uncharacterized protein K452DRAFT_311273 [Aplosporella prunicola CBS 121167]KAF2138808.1 hypothetical protein K452DRAFT_311273 [Aplosporella prunicola CBS 121167]